MPQSNNRNCEPKKESLFGPSLDPIAVDHPLFRHYYDSSILHPSTTSSEFPVVSQSISKVYGNYDHPVLFTIGNGGAGYTGILQALCEEFVTSNGADFCVAWIANHSRLSQIALLGDIVQVALTYEPDVERIAEEEGWCKRVCAPVFWDHWVIAGPRSDPAQVQAGFGVSEALQAIAHHGALFHTRGDGSATYGREQHLWKLAGVDTTLASWYQTHILTPYEALKKASQECAYLLTDRSTFLTAANDGVVPDLVVYVEGGKKLLNSCSALINTKVSDSPGQQMAVRFAEWLGGEEAQKIIREYGRDWERGLALFTEAKYDEFGDGELLAGRMM